MTENEQQGATGSDREFFDGYRDGSDPDCPEPSANRSACYRHSFQVGRAEIAGQPIRADISRQRAALAEEKDAGL